MKSSHSEKESPKLLGLVDSNRHSSLVPGVQSSPGLRISVWAMHGALLAFAFLLLMPTAIFFIRSQHKLAFRIHWMLQVASFTTVMVGIGLALLSIELTIPVGHPLKLNHNENCYG